MKKFFISVFLIFVMASFWMVEKRGFPFSIVSSPLPYNEQWECRSLLSSQEIEPLLSQRFFYLKSGAQMVAFIGEDQKTVLKLMKMNHLLPQKWVVMVPLPTAYRQRKWTQRKERLDRTFQSVKLATAQIPEETGVLFAKLNPGFQTSVTLIDKNKKRHTLNLDHVPFILQSKGELIYTRLLRHLKNNDLQALHCDIEKMRSLIVKRCSKGIFDADSGVSANFGFVGDRAVQLDIGELFSQDSSPAAVEKEVQRIEEKIDMWLKKREQELPCTARG